MNALSIRIFGYFSDWLGWMRGRLVRHGTLERQHGIPTLGAVGTSNDGVINRKCFILFSPVWYILGTATLNRGDVAELSEN